MVLFVCVLELEVHLSIYDERLAALEQTIATLRNDFLQAIIENTHSMSTLNKVILQQEQNARDANHEITILIGVISAQGRDVKDIKNRIDGFDQRFASFDQRFASFDQRFASLEGKLEQVLQILTTPPKTDK
jgi:chromosome segregation ATPase